MPTREELLAEIERRKALRAGPTREELLAEIERRKALRAGPTREELLAEIERRKAPDVPDVPVVPREPLDEPWDEISLRNIALEEAQKGEQRRTERQQRQLEEAVQEEAVRKAGALVDPSGRVDYPTGEGPSKILQSVYKKYFPEAKEDLSAVFERQPVMTEQALLEARRRAKLEGDPAIEKYVPEALRLSTGGVETPFGAALRATGSLGIGAVEYLARDALGYEVDSEKKPVDPGDTSYYIEQNLKKGMGDKYPGTISLQAPLRTLDVFGMHPLGMILEKATGKPLSENAREVLEESGLPETMVNVLAEGLILPTFGPVDQGSEAAKEHDPYGIRGFDSSLDWNDQIVRNARVDRGLKDLFVDMEEVREAYKETYGSESSAFYGGAMLDMFVPDLTWFASPAFKAAKGAGKVLDGALAYKASRSLFGGPAATAALELAAATKGLDVHTAVGKVVARETVGPRALLDAASQPSGSSIGEILARVAPESRAAQWVAIRAGDLREKGVEAVRALDLAYSEMRIAQQAGDFRRLFDAGRSLEDARTAALRIAKRLSNGEVPARMRVAIQRAKSGEELAGEIESLVPRSYSVVGLDGVRSGPALRALFSKADDVLDGRTAQEALQEVEDATKRILGELVPRDMTAVTSRVMVPTRLANPLRKVVGEAMQGTFKADGDAVRVARDKIRPTLQAIERMFPQNLRSGFWDNLTEKIAKGAPLDQDEVARLVDGLQSDAYLRLGRDRNTGRVVAEALANVGRELDVALGTAPMKLLHRNLASRVGGVFRTAKGAPAVFSTMGKAIGSETFGVPKRVADMLRASKTSATPFKDVAEDLAAAAGDLGPKFVEEAWENTLSPLYGFLKESLKKDPKVLRLMEEAPSLEALRAIDKIAEDLAAGSMGLRKDLGKALMSGLVEAEAWVATRKVAQRFLEDNPGMNLSLTPGLRHLPDSDVKGLVSKALSDIISSGDTHYRSPALKGKYWESGIDDEALRYQEVLDAVGSALRTYGVKHLDSGLKADEIAQRVVGDLHSWVKSLDGVDGVFLVPQTDELLKGIESLSPKIAEGIEVLKRAKETDLVEAVSGIPKKVRDIGRAFGMMAAKSDVTAVPRHILEIPIALLAKQGAGKAIEAAFGVGNRALGRSEVFEAGGRIWRTVDIDNEAARLGVGASTRMSAGRRGRLASDLMTDIGRTIDGNLALRAGHWATQVIEEATRVIPGMIDHVEVAFRREVFAQALREGRLPEEAARISRDALLDFEPEATQKVARMLQPIITGGVESLAALESLARRPEEAVRIMRGLRAKQDYVERTYGGDEPIVEPVAGARLLGPLAASWLAQTLEDVVAQDQSFLEFAASSAGDAVQDFPRFLGSASGDLQTFIEGEPSLGTREDEVRQAMVLAALAEKRGFPSWGWEALVERYGMEPVNLTSEGEPLDVPIGASARYGKGPKGGPLKAWYVYKMSSKGRSQFKQDMSRAQALTLGLSNTYLEEYSNQEGITTASRGGTPREVAERRLGADVRKARGEPERR